MKRWLAVLIFLLLLMPVFSMPVSGDGCPISPIEGYSTLRENRQLAYISVGEKEESLNLFLSVVSLDPGQPLTIVIPLKTRPAALEVSNTSESDFTKAYNFYDIQREAARQHEGLAQIGKDISSAASPLAGIEIFGAPMLLYYFMMGMTASMGGDIYGNPYVHYGQPGLSVDLYSFNSSDSLGEFYHSLNVTVPQNVDDILTKYQNYSVAVINTLTKPPIKESDFNNLTRREPGAMADFKKYVSTHSQITVDGYYYFEDRELNDIIEKISDYELRSTFYNLIFATYGIKPANGFQLSLDLPLANENECYFPLGTSPSWNSITKTTVIFDLYDDKEASFNVPGQQVFLDGRHYYIWDFENEAPDYDINGIQKEKGMRTSWAEFSAGMNGWAYDNSNGLAFLIILLFFTLIWASVFILYSRRVGGTLSPIIVGKFLMLGLFLALFSFLFSIFLMLPLVVSLMRKNSDYFKLPPLNKAYKVSPLLDSLGWVWQLILLVLLFSPVIFSLSYIFAVTSPGSSIPISFFIACAYTFMLSLVFFHAYVRYRLRIAGPVVKEEPVSREVSFLRFQSFFGIVLAVIGVIIFTITFFPIYSGFEDDLCLLWQAGYISLGISVSLAILIYSKRGLLTR